MYPIFDLHCDTPLCIKKGKFNHLHPEDLKPSILFGSIFAHFVSPGSKEPFHNGVKLVLSTINYLQRMHSVSIVTNFDDLDMRKTNILLGIEGGHIFDGDLTQFETLYELGVRTYTLTWNNSNSFAHSAFDDDKKGLTKRGKDFLKILKSYDVIIDLSHASTRTVLEVCEITDNQVIASHSCARALNPFVRNIDSEAIKAITRRDGVVGVNFSRKHLGCYRVVDHIDFICENFGVDYCGVGSDFDGINDPICNCPAGYKMLLDDLFKRKYSKTHATKILFKNFLRILQNLGNQGVTSV